MVDLELDATKEERVRALLERINAYIEQYHGGSVEMVGLEGNRLRVRLGGACLGCPLSPNTLHGWVEGTIKQFVPEIEKVQSSSFAGFRDAEENQIIPKRLLGAESTNAFTECCKGPYGIFGVVIVPRDAIVAQECEELLSVLPQALPILLCRL